MSPVFCHSLHPGAVYGSVVQKLLGDSGDDSSMSVRDRRVNDVGVQQQSQRKPQSVRGCTQKRAVITCHAHLLGVLVLPESHNFTYNAMTLNFSYSLTKRRALLEHSGQCNIIVLLGAVYSWVIHDCLMDRCL